MKCLHRIPWKRLVVPRLALNNGVVIPRGEKKKVVRRFSNYVSKGVGRRSGGGGGRIG